MLYLRPDLLVGLLLPLSGLSRYLGQSSFKDDPDNVIEREVPAIVDPLLQERAKAMLQENKRRPNRKTDHKYLLSGLVKCAACGFACTGHSTSVRGKKFFYYVCIDGRTEKRRKSALHQTP